MPGGIRVLAGDAPADRLGRMISTADVERLRERAPTPDSPVLSVYLDVDQTRAANLQREFLAVLKARLRALEQRLPPAVREEFQADATRVQRFVADAPPRGKMLVVFADDSSGFFWSRDVRVPLSTDVRWDPAPYVRPLVEALDEYERYGIVLVDKEEARLFTVFLGEIEEERAALAAAEVRHKKASGTDHWRSQMHFQRQDDMHVHHHLRHTAALMEEVARAHGFDRLLLAGPVEATSALARLLPPGLGRRVVGTLRLAVDTPPDEVLRATLAVAERAERDTEDALVARLREEGVAGVQTTLLAFQEGRVGMLLYAEGFAARGSECTRCRALFPAGADTTCGYCAGRLAPVDDLVGRAVERAGEWSARVEKVRGAAAGKLLGAGGMGAIPRFR